MVSKNTLIVICIGTLLTSFVPSIMAGDISRSFTINVYIPVIPGLNAPMGEPILIEENNTSSEMIATTEELLQNEQKIIRQTIAPK